MTLINIQRRGWEPDAVLNWLALAGWGAHTESSSSSSSSSSEGDQVSRTVKAPDSTTVLSLSEIIDNVCVSFRGSRPSADKPTV
jgi:glutamyl-tRNA synthetase